MPLVLLAISCLGGCLSFGPDDDPNFPVDLYVDMADSDVKMAVDTMQIALETGSDGAVATWTNLDTGNSGRIQPLRTYQTERGYFCRDFLEILNVGGRTASYDNHACRDDDGVWRFFDD
ncbi:MAG: RT0821/Lpp0805 family surface protein [Alphaproteobacteria bacterium]